jgi:hypothetical protein
MKKLLNKAERRFGKYSIQGLMKYIIAIEIAGAVIGIINPDIYYYYLSLDFGAIAHGQIWRLVTFLLYPGLTGVNPFNILIFGLMAWVYYSIGTSLENIWGAFRFNLYYLSGIVLSVLAALIIYLTFGVVWPVGFTYINQALFLAFAFLFPNTTFLLFYIIPVKAKWLGIFYAAVTALDVFELLTSHTKNGFVLAAAIIISMLNFIIFFIFSHNNGKPSYKTYKRRAEFRKEASPKVQPIYRHRCAICGRTERDGADLEFRYCSKCDGNYEYCSDHIFTHEHVHK